MSDTATIADLDQLSEIFRQSETPRQEWLVGMEAEKFGVFEDGSFLKYAGAAGIEGIFDEFAAKGWRKRGEAPGGPVIILEEGKRNITLEPGAQLELSGSPLKSVHAVVAESKAHLAELAELSKTRGLKWLHLGFHPLAKLDELPWVPKQRYAIMKRYLPTRGSRALDMMQRTATIQINLDYSSETDAFNKIQMLLRATPILQALTANSPFKEGQTSPLLSERLDVWHNMDPARSGLIESLWNKPDAGYADYVQWALDAGMFMLKRDQRNLINAGQTFRAFLSDGFEGERATLADWHTHLGSLFPDVRLKNTIEVRGFDALPADLAAAIPALIVGLAYDDTSLQATRDLLASFDYGNALALQRNVARYGLNAVHQGKPVRELALQLLELAQAGLERRRLLDENQNSEAIHLTSLFELAQKGQTPAEQLRQAFVDSGTNLSGYLLAAAT